MTNAVVRCFDSCGRIYISEKIRHALNIGEYEQMIISANENGEIVLKKAKRPLKHFILDWYSEHIDILNQCEFVKQDDYTFCIVPAGIGHNNNIAPRCGYCVNEEANNNIAICYVVAYANAVNCDLNKMVGYED